MAEARQVNDLGLPIGLPMTIYRVANTSIMRAWYQIGRLDAVKEHGFNEVFKFVRDLAIDGLPSRDDEAMQDALDRQFLLFERLVRSLVAQHRLLERSVSNGAGTVCEPGKSYKPPQAFFTLPPEASTVPAQISTLPPLRSKQPAVSSGP